MSHDVKATQGVAASSKAEVSALGLVTGLGIWLLLILTTVMTDGYGPVFSAIGDFFGGRPQGLDGAQVFDLSTLLFIVATLTIMLPAVILTGILLLILFGTHTGHSLDKLFKSGKKSLFAVILVVVAIEELATRWLFLGALTYIFDGVVAYYVLFVVSNVLFAYAHIYNFESKSDRQLLRVMPQFVAGMFFAITFTKYGLFAAILLHFAFNMALFAVHKKKSLGQKNLYTLVCSVAMLIIGLVLFDQRLTDVLQWLQPNGGFALSGWNFVDYLLLLFVITGATGVLAELLTFDRYDLDVTTNVGELVLGTLLVPLLYLGMLWVTSLVIPNQIIQILVTGLLVLCIVKPQTPSHCSKMFWMDIPELFVLLCAITALGFWQGALLAVLLGVVNVIQSMGMRSDTKPATKAS